MSLRLNLQTSRPASSLRRGLALGSLALAGSVFSALPTVAAAEALVSFSYDKQNYEGESLPPAIIQGIYEQDLKRAEQQQQMVNQYILNRYLQGKATEENASMAEIQKRYLNVPAVTDEQVAAFYEENQARIGQPLNQVKPQLVKYLRELAITETQNDLFKSIRDEKDFHIQVQRPEVPAFDVKTDGYPFKGNANAAITVVEFADYQCPHCKDASATVKTLLEQYGDKVKFVYRDYPINSSGISTRFAEGAVCAEEQGKFWEFHDKTFERQQYLRSLQPVKLAEELGLDTKAFQSCLEAGHAQKQVAASVAEGEWLGITGTPTFYVNGVKMLPAGGVERSLQLAIEQAQLLLQQGQK